MFYTRGSLSVKEGICLKRLDSSSWLGTYADFGRGGEEVMHLNNSSLRFSGMAKGLLVS